MSFATPAALWILGVIPLLIVGYVAVLGRRAKRRPESLRLISSGHGRVDDGWRRYTPSALLLLALTGLLFSLARPEANVTLPVRVGKVVLAFDTSNSMLASDVDPTRLDVAKSAANTFVDRQPGSIQIGVVAFTDGGVILQEPTKNQTEVLAAIERLTADGGTSIGEGILASLSAIADDPIALNVETGTGARVDIGSYSNAAIVVFTDGEDIGGANPSGLATLAGDAGVPVYTVGIGTERGTVVSLDGFRIATALDEVALTQIAESTGGSYFLAANDPDLANIFDEVERNFERQGERIEVTAIFAIVSMMLVIAAAGLSLRWFGRVSP